MPIPDSTRLNVYSTGDPDRFVWALIAYTWDHQGVPTAHLSHHGMVRLSDPDVAGIDAVAQMLAIAVARTA